MLQIEHRNIDDVRILDITGTLDQEGAKNLKDTIEITRKDGYKFIVLNLTNLVSAQNTALNQLLTPIRVLIMIGGFLVIYGMQSGVHKVFKAAPFYDLINITDTEDDALKILAKLK